MKPDVAFGLMERQDLEQGLVGLGQGRVVRSQVDGHLGDGADLGVGLQQGQDQLEQRLLLGLVRRRKQDAQEGRVAADKRVEELDLILVLVAEVDLGAQPRQDPDGLGGVVLLHPVLQDGLHKQRPFGHELLRALPLAVEVGNDLEKQVAHLIHLFLFTVVLLDQHREPFHEWKNNGLDFQRNLVLGLHDQPHSPVDGYLLQIDVGVVELNSVLVNENFHKAVESFVGVLDHGVLDGLHKLGLDAIV